MTLPFITAAEIAKDLGVTRQRVHQIIHNQNLTFSKLGNMLLIDKESYAEYLILRKRRDLANAAGYKETKFIRTEKYDTVCPVCGAYALHWKENTICENGHTFNWSRFEREGEQ